MATAPSQSKYGNPANYNVTPATRTDGDASALEVNSTGSLLVSPGSGASFGSSTADGSTFVQGTTTGGISMGLYVASPQTLVTGKAGAIAVDINRNTQVVEQYAAGAEDNTVGVFKVEQRFSYTHIGAGQATTVVKASAGFLHSITFNSAATATNVTTVYDNASGSGTVIAIPAATTATVPTTLTYDVLATLGITIITATANGADMTVSWR